jgi:ATP-dependent DNA helicase RecG
MKCTLETEIQYLKGVGPKVAEVLENLGVTHVEDLLTLVPRRYVGRNSMGDAEPGEEARFIGKIIKTHKKRTSKGPLFTVLLSDGTGTLDCTFFHYSQKATAKFERNKSIEVEGTVSVYGRSLQLTNPRVSFSPPEEEELLPIYPLSEWLTTSTSER